MEEVQVGEYIRTKEFGIAKIIYQISELGFGRKILEREYRIDRKEKGYGARYKEVISKDIVKHSFEKQDLIEEGDILKYKVNKLGAWKIGEVKKYKYARSLKEYLGVEGFSLEQIEILSITTKEVFESIEYKVGE